MLSYVINGTTYNLDAVKAHGWESWNMSFLGAPKIRYVCGRCRTMNHQRPLRGPRTSLAICRCQRCGTANVFPCGRHFLVIE